jgi:hypothetical protein
MRPREQREDNVQDVSTRSRYGARYPGAYGSRGVEATAVVNSAKLERVRDATIGSARA